MLDVIQARPLQESLTEAASQRLLALAVLLPHGVDKMSHAMGNLVETSSNLASIRPTDGVYKVCSSLCRFFTRDLLGFLTAVHGMPAICTEVCYWQMAEIDPPLLSRSRCLSTSSRMIATVCNDTVVQSDPVRKGTQATFSKAGCHLLCHFEVVAWCRSQSHADPQ